MKKFNTVYEGTSFARELLYVDNLSKNKAAQYPRDNRANSYVCMPDLSVYEEKISDTVVVPTFEINSKNYLEQNLDHLESIHKQEDEIFFKLLFDSLRGNSSRYGCFFNNAVQTSSGEYSLSPIIMAMNLVEKNNTDVSAFICSKKTFRNMSLIDHKYFCIKLKNDDTISDSKGLKVAGTFLGIPIFIHNNAEEYFYVLSNPEDLGVLVIQKEYQENTVTQKTKKHFANVEKIIGSEKIGMAIINNNCISAVIFK